MINTIISASTTGDKPLNPAHRTAFITPICNENAELVCAGLRATYESVGATGQIDHFNVYILSDNYFFRYLRRRAKDQMGLCEETGSTGPPFLSPPPAGKAQKR